MKGKTFITSVSLTLLSLAAIAAQAQRGQNQTPQQGPADGMTGSGMMGRGMMKGGAMGQGMGNMHAMGLEMLAYHQQMQQVMAELMTNMSAMRAEKDPAARAKLMAEQQSLLDKMHGQMMRQGHVMAAFMKNCPAFHASQQPPVK